MNVREKKPTRPVWLTVVSQSAVEGDTERTEFMTEGDLVWEGETPCLNYQETEVSGMSGTTTTVRIEPDKVSVIRLGTINSMMEFEAGSSCMAVYKTPLGEVPMSIDTRQIEIERDESFGPLHVHLDYIISSNGQEVTANTMDIEVKDRK
ncbi:DUF1934 domain-containing protein [uncultured Pseudoramibacter sp.]|jgi:uncharacterized beta-barrel protein YwiB (DUF1934 family)|uniref:DUF1934 domain-containing protein n=1 Tax=uncultured Pseudoramibacter sp. TaxID=1623493 RepID=UPI0025E7DA9D|nr:DUF1934 domain-containing protein [uncultured Pseudoramibacter sp.]